jgi:hypothetical protein
MSFDLEHSLLYGTDDSIQLFILNNAIEASDDHLIARNVLYYNYYYWCLEQGLFPDNKWVFTKKFGKLFRKKRLTHNYDYHYYIKQSFPPISKEKMNYFLNLIGVKNVKQKTAKRSR